MALNETWLKEGKGFNLKSFKIVRQDREDGYGGIATCVKNNINFSVIKNESINDVQVLIVKVGSLNIINTYSRPQNNFNKQFLENVFRNLRGQSVLVGDLNALHRTWGCPANNPSGVALVEFLDDDGLVLLSGGTSTSFHLSQSNPLDIAIVDSSLGPYASWRVLDDCGNSDHFPTIVELNHKHLGKPFFDVYEVRDFHNVDWTQYRSFLFRESIILDSDLSFDALSETINKVANLVIPKKYKNYYTTISNPWWDSDCSSMIEKRKRALSEFRLSPSLENYILAKKQIAQSKRFFRDKRKLKFKQFCLSLNRDSDLSYVWSKIRAFKGFNTSISQPIPNEVRLRVLDKMATGPGLSDFVLDRENGGGIELFSIQELELAVSNKNKNSAPGMDEISYLMIGHLPDSLLSALLRVYNGILEGNPIPDSWRNYNILCLPKPNGNPANAEGYRPIILSSCFLKILEVMIKNRLEWFLEKNMAFSWFQTGFRKGQGTQNALALLISSIQVSLGQNLSTMAVFLDIKAAYDHVDISILYNKLINLNTPRYLANLIFSILRDRRLFSRNNDGGFLGPRTAKSGLPQGSPLSTLLFNIYIRDLFNIVPPQIKMIGYADDFVIFNSGRNITESKIIITQTLEDIADWLEIHNLTLSIQKCQAMWFTKGARRVDVPPVVLRNEQIFFKDHVRYLGMYIHRNLKWNKHICHTVDKARKGLNILKVFGGVSWGADPKTLLMVANAIVKSHLDYGSIFLSPISKGCLQKLNTIHFQALRT